MRSRVLRGCDNGPGDEGAVARGHAGAVPARPRSGRAPRLPRLRPGLAGAALGIVAALGVASCGGGGDPEPETVTGRVVSLEADASRYCVSPDRGETQTCVDVPDPKAVEGVDVGECVTTSPDLTAEGSKVEVVDESACAAGDLGDDAPGS